MARVCKYVARNQIENKCHDNYDRHINKNVLRIKKMGEFSRRVEESYCRTITMCRLCEWKRKHGTCPYDSNIKAHSKVKPGQQLLPGQTKLIN